ncbi:hypothetical protein Tco_0368912 [Tanacetum coccineum]
MTTTPESCLYYTTTIRTRIHHRPVLPAALRSKVVREVHELHEISSFVDSRLESIEQFLNSFANQPNETDMNDLESDDESVDTPLVSYFPHSNNDSDDGEVLMIAWGRRMLDVIFDEKKLGNSFEVSLDDSWRTI